MATINRNMFEAGVTTDLPRGASLMVLPLNLIAQIVTNVRSLQPRESCTTDSGFRRSMTPLTLPDYAEHVASSIIWPYRNYIPA